VSDLDICLMKQARRRIQRGGYIQFENLMYRGEYLAGYAGEAVLLRYEPRDITEVLVYRQEGNKEVFLARAFAQNLETETIALDEAKASIRKVREAGKTISNHSILEEIRDRDLFTPPAILETNKASSLAFAIASYYTPPISVIFLSSLSTNLRIEIFFQN